MIFKKLKNKLRRFALVFFQVKFRIWVSPTLFLHLLPISCPLCCALTWRQFFPNTVFFIGLGFVPQSKSLVVFVFFYNLSFLGWDMKFWLSFLKEKRKIIDLPLFEEEKGTSGASDLKVGKHAYPISHLFCWW